MASVTDSVATIRISTGADIIHVIKTKATVETIGSKVRIQWEDDYYFEDEYTNFSSPSGGSPAAVADAIAAFLDSGI